MSCTEVISLVTKSHNAAHDALRELKRLKREGWIDMTCHVLLDVDTPGVLRIREASDRTEAVSSASVKGLTGALIECLLGHACAPTVSAAGAASRPSAASELAQGGPDSTAGAVHRELQPGDSALVVMVEQRHAERVAEEFEGRGLTLRRQLQGRQCEVALRASIEEIKGKITWLEELLEHESDKAGWVFGAERERLESAIYAGRTELVAEQEHLQARLMALRAELEGRLLAMTREAEKEGASEAAALATGIVAIEREIAAINEDLALSILNRLEGLAARASELRERASLASVDAAAAFEDQLHELEGRMRKCRGDLTATLASSASLARRCMEWLRTSAKVGKTGLESTLQNHVKQMAQRYSLLKTDIQSLQRDDSRGGHTPAGGFRQAWRGLRESFDQSMSESR